MTRLFLQDCRHKSELVDTEGNANNSSCPRESNDYHVMDIVSFANFVSICKFISAFLIRLQIRDTLHSLLNWLY